MGLYLVGGLLTLELVSFQEGVHDGAYVRTVARHP